MLIRSWIHNIGNNIAAACKGDITKDISGTPNIAKGPAKPPLATPYSKTAGMDTR